MKKILQKIAVSIFAIFFSVGIPLAYADNPDLSSTNNADVFYDSANPTLQHGAQDDLEVRDIGTRKLRSILSFTLPSLGGTITQISLCVTKQEDDSSSVVQVYPLTQSFAEGTGSGTATADGATWNTYDGVNNWASAGGDVGTMINEQSDSVGVTSPFCIDIQGGTASAPLSLAFGDTANLLLRQETEGSGGDHGSGYYSKEDATPSYRPYLSITCDGDCGTPTPPPPATASSTTSIVINRSDTNGGILMLILIITSITLWSVHRPKTL